ncbi:hypothetical protein PJP10_32615, partial [Mycobacterium kansasii]
MAWMKHIHHSWAHQAPTTSHRLVAGSGRVEGYGILKHDTRDKAVVIEQTTFESFMRPIVTLIVHLIWS